MNPNKFYAEKSALLTALVGQLQSCKYTLEAVKRLEAISPNGEDSDVLHLDQLVDDLQRLTADLRDAVDALV
jgi:hypothetical protein